MSCSPSGDHLYEISELDLKCRPFLKLEKIFPLSIFDCGCMYPYLFKNFQGGTVSIYSAHP